VSIHSKEIINVLSKISEFPRHLDDVKNITTMCFDETNAPKAGLIKRYTITPNLDNYRYIQWSAFLCAKTHIQNTCNLCLSQLHI
jgi:hypothetical protein